ncbi:hypothetical protein Tsubulata_007512, partial [Turnera subulata]
MKVMAIDALPDSLLDSNGAVCDKSALKLDLCCVDQLLVSSSRALKGKSIAAVTLNPRVSDLDEASHVLPSHGVTVSTSTVVPDVIAMASVPPIASWADK